MEIVAKQVSIDNPVNPDSVINFAEGPDFYTDLNFSAILEKKHGLGLRGWSQIDMINISKYSERARKDWATLKYIRFMLTWINFLSGHSYTSEYGLWPEEYEQFFLKTGVISVPFMNDEEKRNTSVLCQDVEVAPSWKREYDEETLRTFKNWFLEKTVEGDTPPSSVTGA